MTRAYKYIHIHAKLATWSFCTVSSAGDNVEFHQTCMHACLLPVHTQPGRHTYAYLHADVHAGIEHKQHKDINIIYI